MVCFESPPSFDCPRTSNSPPAIRGAAGPTAENAGFCDGPDQRFNCQQPVLVPATSRATNHSAACRARCHRMLDSAGKIERGERGGILRRPGFPAKSDFFGVAWHLGERGVKLFESDFRGISTVNSLPAIVSGPVSLFAMLRRIFQGLVLCAPPFVFIV